MSRWHRHQLVSDRAPKRKLVLHHCLSTLCRQGAARWDLAKTSTCSALCNVHNDVSANNRTCLHCEIRVKRKTLRLCLSLSRFGNSSITHIHLDCWERAEGLQWPAVSSSTVTSPSAAQGSSPSSTSKWKFSLSQNRNPHFYVQPGSTQHLNEFVML